MGDIFCVACMDGQNVWWDMVMMATCPALLYPFPLALILLPIAFNLLNTALPCPARHFTPTHRCLGPYLITLHTLAISLVSSLTPPHHPKVPLRWTAAAQ
ncbi:hypothetical protein E2C01_078562 [Portunus trituberculatus]|uniref:Uncharacterized protein n=1 Tax=Portunus trituberculatus TaxID=210409 RepID=A0A5B7IJ46_PORTR|nr:hypothetical protein [Portunus trituberculatus]